MIRVNAIPNSAAAKNYYKSTDYHLEGQEEPAHWHGKGAEMLGLAGEVRQEDFEALAENRYPGTDRQLTAKHVANRRVGYDLTFSPSKSVSLAHLFDDRLAGEFRAAVADTLAEMEREMATRVRKGGKDVDRHTGNMVWADFLHHTSRPIGGQPDPQLHIHAVVFNATYDREEGQWKAGQFGGLKADAPYFQSVFRARLANRLQALGYEIRRTKDDFEIDGIPPRVVKEFSRRTDQIEKTAEALGVTRPETKAKLGATTREKKTVGLTWAQLLDRWHARLRPGEMEAITSTVRNATKPVKRADLARESVQFALDHLLERRSVVGERQVVTEALKAGLGNVTPEGIYAELGSRRDLIRREVKGQTVLSTRGVLAEERAIVDYALKGRGRCRPMGSAKRMPQADVNLSPSQLAAIRHVWTSPDRLILMRGLAGVGKTTALKAALDGIDLPVVALAPSSQASRGELRNAGIEGAETLAKFLMDEKFRERARGGLIVLDEASMAGARDVAALLKSADQLSARVLMLGDRRQHKSVARGDVLAMLEDRAGLPVAEVSDIRRQTGAYKAAVEKLARGDVEAGLKGLDDLGWVRGADSLEAAAGMVVDDYLKALKDGKSCVIVSPTHREGAVLSGMLRQRLKKGGKWLRGRNGQKQEAPVLTGEDRMIRRLVPLNLTPAEMARLEPEPGVLVTRFGAYREETQAVAEGDLLRTTASLTDCAGRRLDNGTLLTLTGFTKEGNLKVKTVTGTERVLSSDAGHLSLAYYSTSHAAQGRTTDRVLIFMPEASFPAVGKEAAYVSVSRGREQAVIYTDAKESLPGVASREDTRMLASDLVRGHRHGIKERLKKRVNFLRRIATFGHDRQRETERGVAYER
jgi:conjugative relaxase-like TrwC/TraI family protein